MEALGQASNLKKIIPYSSSQHPRSPFSAFKIFHTFVRSLIDVTRIVELAFLLTSPFSLVMREAVRGEENRFGIFRVAKEIYIIIRIIYNFILFAESSLPAHTQ